MDTIDLKILEALQENSKISNVALAQKINLTPPSTLERVKKLEESGVIKKYCVQLDPAWLGYQVIVFIAITLVKHQEEAIHSFVAALRTIAEVSELYHLTGQYDYLIKVYTRDVQHLRNFIVEKLTKISMIDRAETFIILSEEKLNGIPLNLVNDD